MKKMEILIENLIRTNSIIEQLGRRYFRIRLEGEVDDEFLDKFIDFLKKEVPELRLSK